ncbi:hypothetical protein GH714_004763 [Hevea brasiliensis]|uniref:Retrotransposon Copia-like N-terminal domain-containing protein n=1 Tax=Hevea brasiliensis TaxID=3981 RepID=A0A6A6MB34_HEVBR|nr:hypothetical protein GH714_004701 [Hevea brasiliensis]KAF2309708.1 hypothetical protein GH714_004707 [Hevea brasiliensis]KAF2309715.1 hypothetical protein GH714_004763 [Hevea brasiliensis]
MMTVEILIGSNYKAWKRDVELAMELVDVDLAMVTPKPVDLANASSATEKQVHTAWHKSNRMCYLTLKRSIPEHLLSGLLETTIAKEFLTLVSQRYKVSINAEIEFGTIVTTYNSKEEPQNVNDFIGICVAEENKLKVEHVSTSLLVSKPH